MAILIPEPGDKNPDTEDWQRLLYRSTMHNSGFMMLMLGNLDNTDEPYIMAGSKLEVNHSLYIAENDELIMPPPGGLVSGVVYYIYAIPQAHSLEWMFLAQEPVFNSVFGGWFSGTIKAVGRGLFSENKWHNKVILDSYGAIYRHNYQTDPDYGWEVMASGTDDGEVTQFILPPGDYRLFIKGGKGGNGGNSGGSNGASGGGGIEGEEKTVVINNDIARSVWLYKGMDGYNGGSGGSYSSNGNGGGGGSSGSMSLVIIEGLLIVYALGGNGGKGGNGSYRAGGNGGVMDLKFKRNSNIEDSVKRVEPGNNVDNFMVGQTQVLGGRGGGQPNNGGNIATIQSDTAYAKICTL